MTQAFSEYVHTPHLYAVRNCLILDSEPEAAQSICICPDYEPPPTSYENNNLSHSTTQ